MKKFLINLTVVLVTLLVMGALRFSWESKIEKEMRADNLLPPKIDLSDRNNIGQAGYAAVLGGFRDAIASYFYLKAHNDSADRNFFEMEKSFNTVVALQAGSEYYWVMGAYYTWGSSFSLTRDNQKLPPIERQRRSKKYLSNGIDFLERGRKNMPESYEIAIDEVRLLKDHFRYPNLQRALDVSEEMLRDTEMTKNEKLLAWGQYVYLLAAVPGNEVFALDETVQLYNYSTANQRVPTQRVTLFILQDQMLIDPKKKIPAARLLFDYPLIEELSTIYTFKVKVEKSDNAALQLEYNTMKDRWIKARNWYDKTDVLAAKLYFLQSSGIVPEDEKLLESELFRNSDHKNYVLGMLEYREQIEAQTADIQAYARSLAVKYHAGSATRTEKDLLMLIIMAKPEEVKNVKLPLLEELGYSEMSKYKLLTLYWRSRNGMAQNIVNSNMTGFNLMPVGNIVSQIRELEETLDIPEEYWIDKSEVYTGLPH